MLQLSLCRYLFSKARQATNKNFPIDWIKCCDMMFHFLVVGKAVACKSRLLLQCAVTSRGFLDFWSIVSFQSKAQELLFQMPRCISFTLRVWKLATWLSTTYRMWLLRHVLSFCVCVYLRSCDACARFERVVNKVRFFFLFSHHF